MKAYSGLWIWLGYALLCLLAGSRWLLDTAMMSSFPPLLRAAWHHILLFAVLGACNLLRPRARFPFRRKQWIWIAGLGSAVWILPDAMVAGAAGRVTPLTEVLVFALVPVVVVFMVAQQTSEFGARSDARRLFGPALAGVSGAALLFSFTSPPSLAGRLWLAGLVASAVLAGVAAVRLHDTLHQVAVLDAGVAVSAAIAFTGFVCSQSAWTSVRALTGREILTELLITATFDGPLLLLGVWLLRDLPPIAFGTRYWLILLVGVGESYSLMRPEANWGVALGAVLMAGSAAWLLRASTGQRAGQDDSGSTLRL